jgi:hypothetical protein
MNIRRISFTASVALLACWTSAAQAGTSQCDAIGGNLLANCGFESGTFSSWTTSGDFSFSSITTDPALIHSGSDAAALGTAPDPNSGAHGVITLSQILNPTKYSPGDTLDISAFLANQGGTPTDFQILLNGSVLLDVANGPDPTAGYVVESTTGVAGVGNNTVTFLFSQDPASFFFDDTSVTVVTATPEPMSIALLGAGLVGLGFLRRRK